MSRNKRQGYEEVESDGQLYLFKADFGFLSTLRDLTGKSLFIVSESINDGDPETIRDVLACSLVGKSGKEADNYSIDQKKEKIEEFITLHGLQECNILASTMLTYSMVGEFKKKQVSNHQTTANLIQGLLISRSQIFKNHALLWVYVSMISGISACLITRLLSQLT